MHKEYLQLHDRCELCGSPKSLELHHIIPSVYGGPDVPDNWIAICVGCHSRLTPRKLLQRKGINDRKASDRKPVRDFIDRAVIDIEGQDYWWEIFQQIFCNTNTKCYYEETPTYSGNQKDLF